MKPALIYQAHRYRLLALAVTSAWVAALPAAVWAGDLPSVGQADFPNDDAVILRHLQHWTLEPDGRLVYEEHRWVKLLNDRAWRRYADPRAFYLQGEEEVELLAARAHLPDGRKLDAPDYSINVVTPQGVSKWPSMSGWRDVAYSFSGVQNDAVLELRYKRTGQPGVRRWVQADLRIGDLDPVVESTVAVTLPAGQELQHRLDRVADERVTFDKTQSGGQVTYRWKFTNIAADPDETRCPPWEQRCGRLRFTNCSSGREWVADILGAVEQAAAADETVTKFATEAAEEEVDEVGKVRAVGKKLRDTFNFVDDWRGWVGRRVRSSAEVFDSCYGSRLEAAGLALAAVRAVGLDARPMVAVQREHYEPNVSTDADLTAIVLEVAGPGGPIWIEPSSGILNRNGDWRNRDLVYVEKGQLQQFALAPVGSHADAVRVRGRLALDEKAEKLTGELTIELTGLFVDPEELRTDDQKRSCLKSIVQGVMPNLKVSDFSVSHLSDDQLRAQVSVESTEPPKQVYDRRMLALAADTPALAEAHLPLSHSERRTPIHLPGHLTEDLELRIKLPDGWQPVILPRALHPVGGDWGRIAQTVKQDDDMVQITRQVSFNVLDLEPGDFATVREAARTLRGDGCRSLVIEETKE